MMKPQELTISGELFEETRNNLDTALKILINRMISTKINKGAVSLKIGSKSRKSLMTAVRWSGCRRSPTTSAWE